MNILKDFIVGFLIGLANLIPGVSGGTFALILGVYERLIKFLNSITPGSIRTIVTLGITWIKSGFSRQEKKKLTDYCKEMDYPFMVTLGIGALFCIVAMSAVMKYLLIHHFIYTYAYFFGLIILSVIIPWRMIKKKNPLLLLPTLVGILLTVWISASVNPYDKTAKKSALLEEQYMIQQQQTVSADTKAHQQSTGKLQYIGKYSNSEYFYIFISGVIAISAMVLPGISGSLVLILMNQYFAVISALANIGNLLLDDLIFLGCMAVGIVVGLLSFARLIEFAFKKFHDTMVCFLVGLIVGSLYSLWPFKLAMTIPEYYVKEGARIELITNYTVYSNMNILPTDILTGCSAALSVLAGMTTMLFFLKYESAKKLNLKRRAD